MITSISTELLQYSLQLLQPTLTPCTNNIPAQTKNILFSKAEGNMTHILVHPI